MTEMVTVDIPCSLILEDLEQHQEVWVVNDLHDLDLVPPASAKQNRSFGEGDGWAGKLSDDEIGSSGARSAAAIAGQPLDREECASEELAQ